MVERAMSARTGSDVVSGGRLLAQQIGHAYAASDNVRAVMMGGSVSRGLADRYSDLEIGVFWAEPPPDDERMAAIERLGGRLFGPRSFPAYTTDPEWVVSEHFHIDEVTIDGRRYAGTSNINTQHFTVGGMERCLADVVERYDTAAEKHELLSAVQHGVPPYGADLLARWQAKAAGYPGQLARRVIREHLWFGPAYVPECFAGRGDGGDVLVLYRHFLVTAQCILQILAALNRVYCPSPEHKWMDWLIGQFRIGPHDLSRRIKLVFRVEPRDGGRELRRLVHETLALVDEHLPEVNVPRPEDERPRVNTDWARRRFADPPWDGYSLLGAIGRGIGQGADEGTGKSHGDGEAHG
jgi:hypothetical protein